MERARAQQAQALPLTRSRRRANRSSSSEHPQGGQPLAAEPPPPVSEDAAPDSSARLATLVRTIETHIVPRLMLTHQRGPRPVAPTRPRRLAPPALEEVEGLAQALIDADVRAACRLIEKARLVGYSPESLLLEWLAPAARCLGIWWAEDRCDFTQVTIGMWRAQNLLWDLKPAFQQARGGSVDRSIVLVTAPRAQHSFGVSMLSEFFRRAGWRVDSDAIESYESLQQRVSDQWFDVLGLSIGSERELQGLPSVIISLREASMNPELVVLVGGSIFLDDPGRALILGADATAASAPAAVALAERLVATLTELACGPLL